MLSRTDLQDLTSCYLVDTNLFQLSNIIQAMQAQASLKEAEAARFMNFIILPFTIVTVIFVSSEPLKHY